MDRRANMLRNEEEVLDQQQAATAVEKGGTDLSGSQQQLQQAESSQRSSRSSEQIVRADKKHGVQRGQQCQGRGDAAEMTQSSSFQGIGTQSGAQVRENPQRGSEGWTEG